MPERDVETQPSNIADFIAAQEAAFKQTIPVNSVWSWSMLQHILLTTLYKNSQLSTGKDDFKPFKNITRPLLNLQYRTEGFDVKDVLLFVDDSEKYYMSFLIKKFHEKWALENRMDTFIDAMVESYVDFGGVLVKDVDDVKPEVVPLESIAFCDQTDILGGPIAIRHYYTPEQLLAMKDKGWGGKSSTASLEDAILLSRSERKSQDKKATAKTPAKYVEVYEIHGNLPTEFLESSSDSETNENESAYTPQIQIVCLYNKRDSDQKGFIILYRAEEPKSPFKFLSRDPIYGRALGLGGAEELFEAQVWTNYDMIRMQDMLDAASKTILKSTDPSVANRNKVRDMDNLSIIGLQMGTDLSQVDTFPRNMALFEKSAQTWETHAQQMSSATDALLGEDPNSGTPFALQNLITQQGQGLHDYRRGKLASFLEEIYREWVIPNIAREITKGTEFLAELDVDELKKVSDSLVTCETNDMIKQKILTGQLIDPAEVEGYKQIVEQNFRKEKSHFIKVLKGEFKDVPLGVHANIAGKQRNLAKTVTALTNVFRFAFSNPQGFAQTMQIPGMAKAFNEILEFSDISPIDFNGIEKLAQQQPAQPPQQSQQPQQPQQPMMQPTQKT